MRRTTTRVANHDGEAFRVLAEGLMALAGRDGPADEEPLLPPVYNFAAGTGPARIPDTW